MSFLLLVTIPNEESRKNGFFFAINHKFGSKKFSYNAWIMNFEDSVV